MYNPYFYQGNFGNHFPGSISNGMLRPKRVKAGQIPPELREGHRLCKRTFPLEPMTVIDSRKTVRINGRDLEILPHPIDRIDCSGMEGSGIAPLNLF